MSEKDNLVIGKIVASHGIKGEVKVMPITDDMHRFDDLEEIIVNTDGVKKNLLITGIRYHKNMVLITFADIKDRNGADRLKDSLIEISREDAPPLPEGRYYIVDLVGIDVFEGDIKLGVLKDVLQTGAADIYIIDTPTKQLMLPATEENILDIDIEEGKMKVSIPEGLWDL
ncbi:ribosome maturation factor RimM [Alkalibacter saccharofermentans]|uniref:Ribosome maturation factor RimM n=1 Tax=Alkalibacter saccharofermentans DSM 14828 TaxID=1120975 RepID=A0A1M4S5S6_9FIRM|nr:ribosome maturation factor RimM [Alkalibacter saccharofermentans]SHE27555.1 16S rRNA processing protein RimM [Alkalibacter saccharofermentans DSM 14828]